MRQQLLQPGRGGGGRRHGTVSLWCHFSSLADRKLSDFMAGHLQVTSKSFSFPLPCLVQLLSHSACSGSCWGTFLFWEQPLANCNSESKRAVELHRSCPQGTQKWCWAQVKRKSTLLQRDLSGCSYPEPDSISSISSAWTSYNSCKATKKKGKKKKKQENKQTKKTPDIKALG